MRSRLRLDTARGVFRKEQNTPHTYCPHLRRSDRTVIKPDQNVEHMSYTIITQGVTTIKVLSQLFSRNPTRAGVDSQRCTHVNRILSLILE